MKQENQLTLSDGRKLGYAEYGYKDGFPLFYFHGLPGSRLEAAKFHSAALTMEVHLIGIDRPGLGLSSPQKMRTVSDWAKDIQEFADALNLQTFSIIGHSGGAPYIAACASCIPERLYRSVVVSGLAPFDYPEAISSLPKSQKSMHWIARYFPAFLKLMMHLSFKALDNPARLKKMLKQLPEIDAEVFESEQSRHSMISALKEAFRQNASGVMDDFRLAVKASGISLEKICSPLVIWHGGMDKQVPAKHAEIYAKVPNAEYHFLKEEGHISLLHNYGEQILASAVEGYGTSQQV